MTFDERGGWSCHSTPDLEVYRNFFPYDYAAEMWAAKTGGSNPELGELRDWMTANNLRLTMAAKTRLGDSEFSGWPHDDRIEVSRVPEGTEIYDQAMRARAEFE